jgi:hypothetical protein
MASEEPGPGQIYAIQARKHIAMLRRARPDITIEIRWCPAHKGIPGNEKADEWAKLAAEKPEAHGVEWKQYSDRFGRRLIPLPRSLAHLKREISHKKWLEAKIWADSRITGKKYQYCRQGKVHQKPDSIPAKTGKRLAARFYQFKTGHCLTGQYLTWTKKRPSAKCWWCPYKFQTREHLFKNCPQWKRQQKVLWAAVRKETGRGKDRFTIRDLFADSRCSQAILEFLSTTDVGRRAGPDRVEEGAQSEISEGEIREREVEAEAQGKEAGDSQQDRDLVRNVGSCTILMVETGQGGG